MSPNLWIGVYRRLDNRSEGWSDDSPRALELHNRRKKALHDALDDDPNWQVEVWGYTDDDMPHEFVEIAIAIISNPAFQAVVTLALGYIGSKLLDAAVDEVFIEPLKEMIRRLLDKQKQEKILDFHIKLPDGTTIRCDPKNDDAVITLHYSGGKLLTVMYNASREEINKLD